MTTRPTTPEDGTSHKLYPLLSTANDKRYNGPMRQIAYDYSNGSPHGVIYQEKYNANGPLVSQIEPAVPLLTADGRMPNEFTERRGDGPSRRFHYTNFNQHHRCEGCGICEDYEANDHWPDRGPQQVLKWYTDFLGLQENTTWLGYDSHWYVNSVTDARGSGPGDASYTTTYTRGPPPPQGIGQIKKITHPDGYFIQYDYEDPTPQTGDPHYITRITDERGNKTEHIRDGNHRIIHTDHKNHRETFSNIQRIPVQQLWPGEDSSPAQHSHLERSLRALPIRQPRAAYRQNQSHYNCRLAASNQYSSQNYLRVLYHGEFLHRWRRSDGLPVGRSR